MTHSCSKSWNWVLYGIFGALLVLMLPACAYEPPGTAESTVADTTIAFPGALGWAAHTPGGRGGKIIRVTTLEPDGPGSFLEAIETPGPRIVVFEVGGVIDLGGVSARIREPFLTIAGQTAPSPGITFIKGGLAIETHDVILQHIRVRPGEAGKAKESGWEVDGIATNSAYDVIVDHCSVSWSTDENLSASGPRFDGETAEDWRQETSHDITFSHNLIAEALSHSTHSKGEHSMGSLIHDNATGIAVVRNLYAHNMHRNPYFKGGARGVVVNNLIYNPGNLAVHYTLVPDEWEGHPYATGTMVLVGNLLQRGPDTDDDTPLFHFGGAGDLELFAEDNFAYDQAGNPVQNVRKSDRSRGGVVRQVNEIPLWPDDLEVIPVSELQEYLVQNAGARPWDRDEHDRRIIQSVIDKTGEIIDGEHEVGGYPDMKETHRPFNPEDWDLRFMVPQNGSYE